MELINDVKSVFGRTIPESKRQPMPLKKMFFWRMIFCTAALISCIIMCNAVVNGERMNDVQLNLSIISIALPVITLDVVLHLEKKVYRKEKDDEMTLDIRYKSMVKAFAAMIVTAAAVYEIIFRIYDKVVLSDLTFFCVLGCAVFLFGTLTNLFSFISVKNIESEEE